DLEDPDENNGDVVTSTSSVRGEHELRSGTVERSLVRRQNSTNVLVGDHLGQPVGAKEKDVVGKRLVDDEIDLHRLRDADRTTDVLRERPHDPTGRERM